MRRAILLGAFCLACAHGTDIDLATLASNSDDTIYEAGKKALAHHEYEVARKAFKRVIDGFPQSAFGAPARLSLADSHFNEGGTANLILAISEYRDFLTLYPSKPESPYAQFQVGEAFYKQRNSPDRDQNPTHKALEEFQRLLELYPDSKYVETARSRVVGCRQSLARSEYLAGYFYEKGRRAYRAAVLRYQGILSDYPDYDHLDEVLYHLGVCLKFQTRYAEACPVLSRLIEAFPTSPFLSEAKPLREDVCKRVPPPGATPSPSPETSPSPQPGPTPEPTPQPSPGVGF